jgi:hypothetical protein
MRRGGAWFGASSRRWRRRVATGQGRGVISERMSGPVRTRLPVDRAPAPRHAARPRPGLRCRVRSDASQRRTPTPRSSLSLVAVRCVATPLAKRPAPSPGCVRLLGLQVASPGPTVRVPDPPICYSSLPQFPVRMPIPCPRALRARSLFGGRTDSQHRTSTLDSASTLTSPFHRGGPVDGWGWCWRPRSSRTSRPRSSRFGRWRRR